MFGSSQGLSFGSGGYAPVASQENSGTPEKKARQEDKQTCMPLTVRLLSDAATNKADDGAELKVHGTELANFVLIGVVEGLVQQATGIEFVLNDASGRIKVRHYQNGDADATTKGLVAGRYASIVGSLRMTPVMHVSALSLRPVESGDEVSYHMIEVAHAALKLTKGGSQMPDALSTPAKFTNPIAVAADPQTPPKETVASFSLPPAPAAVTASGPLAGDALRNAVMAVFRKEGEEKPEGVPVATVMDKMKGTQPESIRKVIDELVGEGEVFTTIDDEHFSVI